MNSDFNMTCKKKNWNLQTATFHLRATPKSRIQLTFEQNKYGTCLGTKRVVATPICTYIQLAFPTSSAK